MKNWKILKNFRIVQSCKDKSLGLDNGNEVLPFGTKPDLSQNDPSAADYVKNRTHYEAEEIVNEPLNITWDGNTEGLVSSSDGWLYKISDAVLNDEQIKSVTITSKDGSILHLSDMWDGLIVTEDVVVSEVIAFCRKDGASDGYCTYPEAGIYTIAGTGLNYLTSLTTTEPVEQTKTVVKKLDKKFLPDDVGGDFVATFKRESESITCDKTFEECWYAIKNGTLSSKLFRDFVTAYNMQVTEISKAIYFAALSGDEARLITLRFIFDSDLDPDIWIHYFEDGTIAKGENKFPS